MRGCTHLGAGESDLDIGHASALTVLHRGSDTKASHKEVNVISTANDTILGQCDLRSPCVLVVGGGDAGLLHCSHRLPRSFKRPASGLCDSHLKVVCARVVDRDEEVAVWRTLGLRLEQTLVSQEEANSGVCL